MAHSQESRFACLLTMVAACLAGAAVWLVARCATEPTLIERVSEDVEALKGAELREADAVRGHALVRPAEQRELADLVQPTYEMGVVDLRVGATVVGGGPLMGARFEVVSLQRGSAAKHEAVTDESGAAMMRLPAGRYGVRAFHAHYGLMVAPYRPSGVINVPCADVETEWLPAYACGFELRNGENAAEVERHRFSVDKGLTVAVTGESQRYVLGELEKKGLPGRVDVSFASNPPPHRTLTIFDKVRGPCIFILPLVPVAEYRGPTECDLRACPVVEAMGQLEVRVVDAAGFSVPNAMVSVRRSLRYAGVYENDSLPANRVCWVPPGSYAVLYQSTGTGDRLMEQVVVVSGVASTVALRLPGCVYEVGLTLGRDGLLQVADAAGRFAQPRRVSAFERVVLGLPEGNVQLCLTVASSELTHADSMKCGINVMALRETQEFSVF